MQSHISLRGRGFSHRAQGVRLRRRLRPDKCPAGRLHADRPASATRGPAGHQRHHLGLRPDGQRQDALLIASERQGRGGWLATAPRGLLVPKSGILEEISSLEGRKGYRKAPKSSRNRRFGASKAGKWAETPRFLMVSQDVANVYDIEAAAVQVYNEQVDDLLNPDHQNGQGAPEKRCFVARFGAASRLFRCVLPGFSSFLSGFRL